MKTRFKWLTWMSAAAFLFFAVFAFAGCKKDKNDEPDNRPYTLTGNATGAQMVPVVEGDGTGTFTGTYDPATRKMSYTTTWNGLTGAPTSGGFYTGAKGAAGTAAGDPWTMGTDWTGTGSTTGTMTLTPEQANDLINGNMYYSMGTAANSGGEIRGQISATR